MDSRARETMKNFWIAQAKNADTNEMCLDSNSKVIGQEEIPEILSYLPGLAGKRVLELACGIGRFTGHLARVAKHVTAVDFMEKYVDKCRELTADHQNITYIADDALNLSLEKNSIDILFTNWLLIYLTDDEVTRLLERLLDWLTDGGFLFFRETCYAQIGNSVVGDNPTHYRNPAKYNQLFMDASIGGQDTSHLELIFARHLLSIVKLKDLRGSVCWLLQKRKGAKSTPSPTCQSPDEGDQKVEQNHIKMLGLQPGQNVLHVGCGNGYLDFYMTKEYGVKVHAIDASHLAIEVAWKRKGKVQTNKNIPICFETDDVSRRPFPAGTFDVVYMASELGDCSDRMAIFDKIVTWLKPGGKLLVRGLGSNDSRECPLKDFPKVFANSMKMTHHKPDEHQVYWSIAEKTK